MEKIEFLLKFAKNLVSRVSLVCFVCFIRCLTPPGHSECITAALQPVKYLQKYSREQTIESASDEMTYKLVKFHGTKEG